MAEMMKEHFCWPLHEDELIDMLYSDNLSDVPNDCEIGLRDNEVDCDILCN